jgi:hypothetical protein
MAILTSGELKEALYGLLGGNSDAAKTLIDGFALVKYKADKNVDAATSTSSTFTFDYSTPNRFRVDAVKVVPHAALTSENTNNATIALVYNNGNGGSDTTVATINTATTAAGGSGDWTAGVGVAVTITAANAVVPSGSQLQVKITKNGAGAIITPTASVIVKGTLV